MIIGVYNVVVDASTKFTAVACAPGAVGGFAHLITIWKICNPKHSRCDTIQAHNSNLDPLLCEVAGGPLRTTHTPVW